jgi:hypothetical protein
MGIVLREFVVACVRTPGSAAGGAGDCGQTERFDTTTEVIGGLCGRLTGRRTEIRAIGSCQVQLRRVVPTELVVVA